MQNQAQIHAEAPTLAANPMSLLRVELAPYAGKAGSTPLAVAPPTHPELLEIAARLGLVGWMFELFRYGMARRLFGGPDTRSPTLSDFGDFHQVGAPVLWGLMTALTETEAWRGGWVSLAGSGPLLERTLKWNSVVELALIGATPAGTEVLASNPHVEPSWWFGAKLEELLEGFAVEQLVVEVLGPRRTGKTALTVFAATKLGLRVCRPSLFSPESLQLTAQWATLIGGVVLVEPRTDDELRIAEQMAKTHRQVRVVIERDAADEDDPLVQRLPITDLRLALGLGTREERRAQWTRVWRGVLEADAAAELGSRHTVPVGDLIDLRAAAMRLGRTTSQAVTESVRGLAQTALSGLAVREASDHNWQELIVSERTAEQLEGIVRRYQLEREVMQAFPSRAHQIKRKCTAMFSGAPGTGKTMAARLVAARLGLPCFRIDLASVVSKYIGETEKKLREIFIQCRRADVVILFDEADSLFAKRTSVRTSNDRYANLEVNYLLQSLERFEGVAILTTNHPQSIDEAFERRLEFLIHFEMPTPTERRKMWEVALPDEVLGDAAIDLDELSERFELSGALIRKCVERALFKSVAHRVPIDTALLAVAAEAELGETGCLVRHEESVKTW
ncbi:MAG: hypothetical protein CO108_19600 [Deltaproteobacteria bacterium CG_4_9_14_3_um_filter_63_12]|nr:MAG: hypothetical protein CO108_19600 [Deltaproteobacteria bacterium CG_4_9_14_3_um_filter_63_12]